MNRLFTNAIIFIDGYQILETNFLSYLWLAVWTNLELLNVLVLGDHLNLNLVDQEAYISLNAINPNALSLIICVTFTVDPLLIGLRIIFPCCSSL